MTISRDYARNLIRQGKAREETLVSFGDRWPDLPHMVCITRHDLHRFDHCVPTDTDYTRLMHTPEATE